MKYVTNAVKAVRSETQLAVARARMQHRLKALQTRALRQELEEAYQEEYATNLKCVRAKGEVARVEKMMGKISFKTDT